MRALAAAVAARLPGWRIRGATLASRGTLEAALADLGPGPAMVYPHFMADGWFVRRQLPRRLGEAGHPAARVLPPFGVDTATAAALPAPRPRRRRRPPPRRRPHHAAARRPRLAVRPSPGRRHACSRGLHRPGRRLSRAPRRFRRRGPPAGRGRAHRWPGAVPAVLRGAQRPCGDRSAGGTGRSLLHRTDPGAGRDRRRRAADHRRRADAGGDGAGRLIGRQSPVRVSVRTRPAPKATGVLSGNPVQLGSISGTRAAWIASVSSCGADARRAGAFQRLVLDKPNEGAVAGRLGLLDQQRVAALVTGNAQAGRVGVLQPAMLGEGVKRAVHADRPGTPHPEELADEPPLRCRRPVAAESCPSVRRRSFCAGGPLRPGEPTACHAASRGAPIRARCGAKRQARPSRSPETVAIMPAALTAFSPPSQSGPYPAST